MIIAYNTQGLLGIGTTRRQARDNSSFKEGNTVIYFEGENINDKQLKRI